MSKDALLFRLSPLHWPNWERELSVEPRQWFRTGRRRTDDLHPGIPAVVLGTCGIGLVGFGQTTTAVEFRSDPYWHQSPPEYQEIYKRKEDRIRVEVEMARVPVSDVKANPVTAPLLNRRETTTWISVEEYGAFNALAR